MKKLLTAICLLVGTGAWAQTNLWALQTNNLPQISATNSNYFGDITNSCVIDGKWTVDASRLMEVLKEDPEGMSNVIHLLIIQGEICKAVGHQWRDGRPGEVGGFTYADWHPGITFRTCNTCGVCQSKTEGQWK